MQNQLRAGLLLGAALLLGSALPQAPVFAATASSDAHVTAPAKKAGASSIKADASSKKADASAKKSGKPKAAAGKSKDGSKSAANKSKSTRKSAQKDAEDQKPGKLADFGSDAAPDDVVHVANWVSYTRNNRKKAFVVIDKKNAELYVFAPDGKLKSHAPILLGKAVGDDSAPGIGSKPLSQIAENEKTTPAGRFLARPGKNNHGENIIWIDYDAAVSMHRMRKVSEEERRAERMASPEKDDNRISNGCVNVPHAFYDRVLRPAVLKYGAYIYVLPETRTPQQQFGSYDVEKRVLAQAAESGA
ncbi:MAG TPA: hypothetical protein VFM98_10080 [Ramlibacter sp.]|uniref:hypothetical protein n=1 Tax=Ramlibacter sp. TaxID=1917967 RepID=UPI002D7F1FD0|nr:hypothetical protein [Ramlibacter sp.]HET8745945.1 hypothetical protein [Ramlibacter sp.]